MLASVESERPFVDRFDVFLRGPRENTPEGLLDLARRMEADFGISATAISERLARGHVRVKRGVAEAMARTYVDRLQKLGGLAVAVPEGQEPPPLVRRTLSDLLSSPKLVAIDGTAAESQALYAEEAQPSAPDEEDPELELDVSVAPGGRLLSARRTATPSIGVASSSAGRPATPRPPTPRPATTLARPGAEPGRIARTRTAFEPTPTGDIAWLGGALRARPVTRLILVFAFALLGGFIPALIYSRGVQNEEIKPLRTQEIALRVSRTADSTQADEIRVRARAVKRRAAFVIIVMWVVVGGAAGYTVHRFT